MATNTNFVRGANPAQAQAARERRRSSAAGVRADQRARRNGTGHTNRVGSRSSARAAAVRFAS